MRFVFQLRWLPIFVWFVLGLIFAAPASAGLLVNRTFGGGTAPGVVNGSGNLTDIFNVAADWWEQVYPNPNGDGSDFVVSINYQWATLSGPTLGLHNLLSEGGTPHRETSALIRFDNDRSNWFLDGTPADNSEFSILTETSADLGGGLMNVGRVFTGATGAAAGNFDMLGVAFHEIGHALGLSSANNAFVAENVDLDVDVTAAVSPTFAGSAIPTVLGAHLNLSTSLMAPSVSSSRRNLPSTADVLANAQISQFVNPVLTLVPEPSTLVMLQGLGLGCVLLMILRRRNQRG